MRIPDLYLHNTFGERIRAPKRVGELHGAQDGALFLGPAEYIHGWTRTDIRYDLSSAGI